MTLGSPIAADIDGDKDTPQIELMVIDHEGDLSITERYNTWYGTPSHTALQCLCHDGGGEGGGGGGSQQ